MYTKITALLIAAIMPILAAEQIEIPSISSDTRVSPCNREDRTCNERRGRRGHRGRQGPSGPAGATGATGPSGTSDGIIIPYSSGTAFALSIAPDGTPLSVAVIAFGASEGSIEPDAGIIEISSNFAYSMPRNATITAISAQYSSLEDAVITNSITITAQLYASTDFSGLFAPIPGAFITLAPALTGDLLDNNQTYGLISNLNIPVTAQTRLLLVFSASSTLPLDLPAINGTASAGVSFL